MDRTYTIPYDRCEAISKKVEAEKKKADRYGALLRVTIGEPYWKEFPVYSHDYETGVMHKTGIANYEVFDLSIESEIIQKRGYKVVAKIEHLDVGNVISGYAEHKPEWVTLPPRCEHCGVSHGQRTTYIVRHNNGTEMQVGRTCLKEYCGIDPQAIGVFNELDAILDDACADHYDFPGHGVKPGYKTIDALAISVDVIRAHGYRSVNEPSCNRDVIRSMLAEQKKASAQGLAEAKRITAQIESMSEREALGAGLDNVRTLLLDGYCKSSHMGYIAYAPLGLERYLARKAKQEDIDARKTAERLASHYVGEVGQRINVRVAEIRLLTSWETTYGATYLYKITDKDGNVLVWFASRLLRADEMKAVAITGTVKDHSERDGIRQTVITRCRVS